LTWLHLSASSQKAKHSKSKKFNVADVVSAGVPTLKVIKSIGATYASSPFTGFAASGNITFSYFGPEGMPASQPVSISAAKMQVEDPSPSKLALKVNSQNGYVNGSFLAPPLKEPVSFNAVVFQKQKILCGPFVIGENLGYIGFEN